MFFVLLFLLFFIPFTESINCVSFNAETGAGSINEIFSIPKHYVQCDQCVSYLCQSHNSHSYILGAGCLGDLLNDCRLPRETVGKIATSMQTYSGCYHTMQGIFWFCYGRPDCDNDKHLLQCF
uniref:Uncharacterized protein n=1 Tax=Panagrolaimus davidi TaxID=227884 RepID=A0A914PUY4_9BILA